MKKIIKGLPIGLGLIPGIALAQDFSWLYNVAGNIGGLVETLIPLVIAIGLLFFIWGLVQFIAASGDEAAKEEGKRKMIWGVIALFVIVAVWGIVNLLVAITGTSGGTVTVPDIPTST